jgi:hypothetical protein
MFKYENWVSSVIITCLEKLRQNIKSFGHIVRSVSTAFIRNRRTRLHTKAIAVYAASNEKCPTQHTHWGKKSNTVRVLSTLPHFKQGANASDVNLQPKDPTTNTWPACVGQSITTADSIMVAIIVSKRSACPEKRSRLPCLCLSIGALPRR